MKRVVVVGNADLDVCIDIDSWHLTPGRQYASRITFNSGGGLPNVGLTLMELGVDIEPVGAVGDDPLGGILSGMLPWSLPRPTGSTTEVSVIATGGDRTILNQQGSATVSLARATSLLLDHDQVIMAYLNCSSLSPADTVAFVRAVRKRNGNIVAGINGVFSSERRAVVLEAIPHLDLLVMNEVEAMWVSGMERLDDALAFLSENTAASIVTRGANGAVYLERRLMEVATAEFVPAPHSLGAGDAFLAGVASALAVEMDCLNAFRVGCHTATRWVRGDLGRLREPGSQHPSSVQPGDRPHPS